MIPQTLHYCWFGGNPFSELHEMCFQSWREHLPGFTVKLWNESNSPLEDCPFVREAFRLKRWAFVSDYVRLYALFHEGGIYMDTDMLVLKPLDIFLQHQCFAGFEDDDIVSVGILGSMPQHPYIKDCVDHYQQLIFDNENPETIPNVLTRILKAHGLTQGNVRQTVFDVDLYPTEYFYPWSAAQRWENTDFRDAIQPESYAVHLWDYSWWQKTEIDYLNLGQYEVAFPMIWRKIRKKPFQPFRLYRKTIKHLFRYCFRRLLNKQEKQ